MPSKSYFRWEKRKNVQIDPQKTKIWSTDLKVPLSVRDGRSE